MNNLELHAICQAEEEALQKAFDRHGLLEDDRHDAHSKRFPELLRDVLNLPDEELVEKLKWHIATGADVDATPSWYGVTPIRLCFGDGKMASMRVLLQAGAKINWTKDQVSIALGEVPEAHGPGGVDLFWFACRVGNIDAARAYISLFDGGRNKSQDEVIAAVQARSSEIVKWLMELGFDPNAVDDIEWGALERAVENDDLATAEALLIAGAAPFGLPEKSYTSPVQKATSDPMRRLFVAYGINPANFDYANSLEGVKFTKLPEIALTQAAFDAQRTSRAGTSNPEQYLPEFWSEQLRTGRYSAPKELISRPGRNHPVWSFSRFGRSVTELPDGRLVFVAGEHEDHYDDDFCIYADATVLNTNGEVEHYIYPAEVFPPTDFHSATLVKDQIWLIGSLGYPENRRHDQTQVLCLNINDFSIKKMRTTGAGPGWIHGHRSVLMADGILVTGGKVEPGNQDNDASFILDITTLTWTEHPRVGRT